MEIELKSKLENIFNDISSSLKLNRNALSCKSNYSARGAKAGLLIAHEIDINESTYPPDSSDTIAKSYLVLYIKPNKTCFELLIRNEQFRSISLPTSAEIKNTADKLYVHVLFSLCDNAVFTYIKENILYCLQTYTSSNTFGCCSKYKECSAAHNCLHENYLYAKGCQYRSHLEAGRIFYCKE